MKHVRVAFYLRVSTDGQTTDNQRVELEKVARHRHHNPSREDDVPDERRVR